jgi:hypothetical protein
LKYSVDCGAQAFARPGKNRCSTCAGTRKNNRYGYFRLTSSRYLVSKGHHRKIVIRQQAALPGG